MSEIRWYSSFCVWLVSFFILISRSIHVFFFKAKQFSNVCKSNTFFLTHSSVSWWVFKLFVIRILKTVLLNMRRWIYLWQNNFIFFGYTLFSRIHGSLGKFTVILWGNCTVIYNEHINLCPWQYYVKIHFLHVLTRVFECFEVFVCLKIAILDDVKHYHNAVFISFSW